ncbi:MAG: DNA polymerase III subunit delta [Proteobacteria bacterium]|nr:DNA polymerase III subunit delta [Pseudomonadota bacterium]
MTAIKAADVDRFVAKPDPRLPVVLVYGPDAGLVRERVDALVKASVDDVADPFSFVRLEGEDISANPSRLVEEAHTVPLFGGRRAVLVRPGSRNIASAVEQVIAAPSDECRIIIEAGDLKKSSPLRALIEKAKVAAALPCYVDNAAAIGRLIDDEMTEAGLAMGLDARNALIGLLGGDRAASRNEIRKLALYARGKERVELDDVMAVVADASALALDGVIDAAFAGKTADVETEFGKARAGGSSPAAIISAAIRHGANLHKMRLAIDDGDSADFAMKRGAPPVHFSRERKVGDALRVWSAAGLVRAMGQLAEASLEARRNAPLADAIAQRVLLSLAVNARRRDG